MLCGVQVSRTHELVMRRQMAFGIVITKVGTTWLPVDKKLSMAGTISDPLENISIALGSFSLIVSLAKPSAVELST